MPRPEQRRLPAVLRHRTRRNLTKGQQAMAYAVIYPEGMKGKRSPETGQLSKQRISEARAVLRADPQLAEAVLENAANQKP